MSDWGYRDDDDEDVVDEDVRGFQQGPPARVLIVPRCIGWLAIPRVYRRGQWRRLPGLWRLTIDDALAAAYELGWQVEDDLTPDVVVRERR